MKNTTQKILLGLTIGLAAGCSKTNFKDIADTSALSSPSAVCVPGQRSVTKPTKFIFLVDMSGSNVDGSYENPGIATDLDKSFRFNVVNEFLRRHGSKSTMSWELISFHKSAAQALVNAGNDQAPKFSTASDLTAALSNFLNITDVGDTPYKSALKMASRLIQQDIAASGPAANPAMATQYRIAMLTDGYPTDYCPGGPTEVYCAGRIMDSALLQDVQNLINLAPSAIKMSTVYYGQSDADAASRLAKVANVGKGQFVDANVTKEIDLDDVIEVPETCQ